MTADINIYCDESRHTSDPADRFMVIGALACPRDAKRDIVHAIHCLQAKHRARGEFGWSKVAPGKADFFRELAALFLGDSRLRFRCLVTDRTKLDHHHYNDGDEERGFYKLYYQTLCHWLEAGNRYHVYLDWQRNAAQHRFSDLRLILGRTLRGKAELACLEPVSSDEQPLIQLTDLLIGAVGYAWNQRQGSEAKRGFCAGLAAGLEKRSLCFSSYRDADPRFNIFHFTGGDR